MYVVGIRRCKNKKLGFTALFSVACQDDYGKSVFSEGKPTPPPPPAPGVFLKATFLPSLLGMFGLFVLGGYSVLVTEKKPFPYSKEGILS